MASPQSLRAKIKPTEWDIMGKTTTLLTLDLSNQRLSQLPDELYELTDLEALKLRINGKGIKLSDKLIRLTNLKVLTLNECNLDTVPAVVMKLERLEVLILSKNKNITLPEELCGLVNLSVLKLGNCDLKTVPAVVGKLSQLKELRLWENKKIKLPDEMSGPVNLTHLDLYYCDLDTFPPVVLKLSNLQELDLSYNQISLPDEFYKLQNIKVLRLSDFNLATVPPAVLKLTQLEELDLSGNRRIHLTDELSGLTNIRVLNLGETHMVTVPPVVWTLTKLEWLDLDSNPLQTLPAGIGQITSIKHLDLFDCKLRTLPSEIWRLTQLEWLGLSYNPLQTLSAEIGKLTNIEHLNLSNCELRTLPPDVWRLTQLEWLNLSSNPLQTLPAEIGQLTNIEHLDLSKCELRTLPPEVWRLTQLEWLNLSSNPLQTLPAEIGQLTNIEHLDLSNCELRTLPSEVWRLTQLEWLDLRYNPLQTLPAEIGQIIKVKHLDLSWCKLRTLPPEVGRLTQLERLNLSSNPLQTLPAEIGQLTNIEHLHLFKCELRTLPSEVWRLTQLERLDLSSNPIQTLPAEIGQLTNIKQLDLCGCELHTLPPEVGRLAQLEWLNLSSNPLQTLPAEIGQLTNIKHLDLSECELRTLPPEVGRLKNLKWLNLSSNSLQALPMEIAQLENVSYLRVDENPLIKPPAEVCSEGITAIRQYFDELERSQEEVSARLKVVVLGEKMAGKTSLVQTLNRGQSSLTEREDRTHCVEITQWAPEDNITFEVYDFGGHDVYHLTHQFFLTQGALNLLTVNLHEYRCTEQCYTEAVGFWLDTLNARVPGAVVTLVCSKTDMCSDTEIEEKTRDIQVRFSQQHDMWTRTIQQQMKKLESNKATNEGTDQGEIQQQLERTRQLLTRPLRITCTGVYCVSSAEPTAGLDELRGHILETANNTSLFPSLQRILPRTWMDFERQMHGLRGKGTEKRDYRDITTSDDGDSSTGDGDSTIDDLSTEDGTEEYESAISTSHVKPDQSNRSKWLRREECLKQGQLAGLTADRLEPALSYLQQVGTILRYTDIPELKDFVFHDPSGLIDVMKELFHHDLKKVFNNKNPRLKSFSNTHLKKIRKNLSRRGFLPREVVFALLGPHATPVGNVDVITSLMEHFGLCYTEWSDEQEGETSTSVGYYIPWYIKEERPEANRDVTGHKFIVTCEIAHFCPRGLFERLSVVINKLIKSRQDWKDIVSAVTDSFPVIVYREEKTENVNIVVKLTVPAQAVQEAQVIWDTISPLKDKLSTLLKEWPGLLYRLVYSTFTQPAKQKGDQQQALSVSSIIPTFEVGPRGCTVQHGGVTLEFPEGCVRDTRFISVEVEAVPVTEDVRTNFTAMSAVLTVEQDFPQRFLRPVTVRLPWVWTQSGQKEITQAVVLHYNREDGWTIFPTDIQEGPETVVFQTDRFQSYVVTKVKGVCTEIVQLWGFIWNGYCEDKVYLIVMPNKVFLADPFVNLLCVHKTDDVSDFFSIGYVSQNHQVKQRISMTNKERIRACMQTDNDLQIDQRDFRPDGMIFEFPPADRNRYTFAVEKRPGVPETDTYQGRIGFERLDLRGNVKEAAAGDIDRLPVLLHRAFQGVTPDTFVPEDEHLHVVSRQRDPDLRERSPSQQHQAKPQPTIALTARYLPALGVFLAMAVVAIAAIVYPFYSTGYIDSVFRLPSGEEDAPHRWFPLTVVAGLFAAIFGIWFLVYRKGKPVVMLVNDEFGTSKGGISTINGQLRDRLISEGAKVIITVLNATEEEKQEALSLGIDLVVPITPEGDKRTPTLNWLTYDHKSRYPNIPSDINVIVGHADVTSKAARNIREDRLPKSKFILFNHVMPEDTEHHKSGDKVMSIEDKTEGIRRDTEEADVVFSVGPTMHDYYKNQIRLSKPHHLFLPKPSDIFSQMNVTYVETETKVVLCVGRVKGVEKLKGYDLVAKAMDKVLSRFPKALLRVRGVSAEDFPDSKEIIQANIAKGTFHFTPLKYGTQQRLSRDFKEAHVVLMPSRAEPFGLVGLEAIAAGVPTIVSDQSGLAKFLKAQDDVIFDRPIVKIKGDDEEDATRLADRIVEILENGSKEFKAAKELKQKLMASKYWEESHRKFLEECCIQK